VLWPATPSFRYYQILDNVSLQPRLYREFVELLIKSAAGGVMADATR
jgi:hypothetical protein